MKEIQKDEFVKFMTKYKTKLEGQLATDTEQNVEETKNIGVIRTREYAEFKEQYRPRHISYYEKMCKFVGQIMKVAPDKKKIPALQNAIDTVHLDVTPADVYTFSLLFPLAIVFIGFTIFTLLLGSLFFGVFFVLVGLALIPSLGKIPFYMAQSWRLKASSQMVLAVFYVVTYMRHTSNLELAVDFSSEYLSPPLSLDMKRVIWNVETEKFDSIKESLDDYLAGWKDFNMEFVESFHLIEGSLYEGDNARRLDMLDKSLSTILDETYEKMLHYAHNLKSPITMLHMLGIILPILTLVILPLVVSFMKGIHWYHLSALYNVLLPISVFLLGRQILASRPTGYGDTDISESNPELKKFKGLRIKFSKDQAITIPPFYISFIVTVGFLFLFFVPLIMHLLAPGWDLAIVSTRTGIGIETISNYEHEEAKFYLLGYQSSVDDASLRIGPYGLGAALLALALPLSIGLGVGLFYKFQTENVLQIRQASKKLEQEFGSALFSLGNRLGDGFPAEIAFSKVAESMQGTISGEFFEAVSSNITRLGMSVEKAIFDPSVGALNKYPSSLIETSMKVLVESSKKGPRIAAQALVNVSRYIKEMHSVNERLKDLMADIISSMKSQTNFLTPVIAGIVIGITSMVTTILGRLGNKLAKISEEGAAAGQTGLGITNLFGDGLPTYHFQIIVGLYVVQLVYILTVLGNGIENGEDKLNERYMIGRNMVRSTLLYCGISFAIMLAFNMIAQTLIQT